jgi:hypothetical protein
MKLAKKAYVVTLILLTLVFAVSGQLSEKEDRNTAPTVGTGGSTGGPTGLFTVYDGKTLRKGEYTVSAALSNYDRDPGNVDITSIPLSFQVGVANRLELFFTTEGYRGVKVNAPRNLSGFYLPNAQVRINGVLTSAPAIVLSPQGPGTSQFPNRAIFRPAGAPFTSFPYTGGNAGTYGLLFPIFSGNVFGFNNNGNALLGPPRTGGAADLFPGVGSVFGGILPGVVFSTQTLFNPAGQPAGTGPVIFTSAPTYIADAPFIDRTWGTSSFNSMDFGFKYRFNNPEDSIGYGVVAYYRWYLDTASSFSGFNMMQRGAGPGGNKGDLNVTAFADARLAKWANLSANVGYQWTSKTKGTFGGTSYIMLDRPDELQAQMGLDFPVNRYFQPILEFKATKYVGGRTPNALERNPLDGIAGVRIFPRRWFGLGFAYRHNFNEQDFDSFKGARGTTTNVLTCATPGCTPITQTSTFSGVPQGFATSNDPHGYIVQFWAGKRDARKGDVINKPANVDSVDLNTTVITLPCPPGSRSASGACSDNKTVTVNTKASDPENDVLTYNYTVSGGRVVGTGANVQWDLSNAQAGTYTITAGVDDGCGICGKTETKTIKVQACPDCVQNCSCPSLSVSGPTGITAPGSPMTFTANVSGGTGEVTYNWSVSAGEIMSGQGSSSIMVRTTKEMANSNVTATVEIGGTDPSCNCPRSDSETAGIGGTPEIIPTDEFGPAENDDVKVRIDNFYLALDSQPNSRGVIINYGTPDQIKKRKAQILTAIKFRKKDASRIEFIDGPDKGTGISTKFFVVPAGAEKPQP